MKMRSRAMTGLLGLIISHAVVAQSPAEAPAGANGMCKDGSYSTAASKDGACRGHKGVQVWYGAATAKAAKPSNSATASKGSIDAPAGATVASKPTAPPVASRPANQAAAPMAAAPPAPLRVAPPVEKPSATRVSVTRGELAEKPAAPGGGNGLVWVNTASNVYHCPGTSYYGKTKAGAYMSEADAKAKGARADAGRPCTK